MKKENILKLLRTDINPRISTKELAVFLNQLSIMTSVGIGIHRALEISQGQMKKGALKSLAIRVIEKISKGSSFSHAIAKEKFHSSKLLASLVEAGELGGKLSQTLADMSDYYMEKSNTERLIKSSLIYPLILLLVSIFVVVFMLVQVLPSFSRLFEGRGQNLPGPTAALLLISQFLANYGLFILLLIITITGCLALAYKKRPDIKLALDKAWLNFPLWGSIVSLNISQTTAVNLAILSSCGVSVIEALKITGEGQSNAYVEEIFEEVSKKISTGVDLSLAFEESQLFSKLFVSMVEVGVQSSTLPEVMKKTADYYKKELEHKTKMVLSYFEPIMIMVMALIVGFIVISIALPMFELTNL